MPYLLALLIGLALIVAFPVVTLILPRLFLGYR
jgi:TRAP-type C4-dicarboxylate transport system permease large subunit